MKKKLLSLILLFTLIFLGGTITTKAVTFEKGATFTKVTGKKVGINGLTYGPGSPFSIRVYDFTNSTGDSFISYCMDPNAWGTKNLKMDRILGDQSMSENVRAHDYGLLEIIKNGYNQYNHTFTDVFNTPEQSNLTITLSGDELYAATSIAVRAWTLGFFQWGKDSDDLSQYLASAEINLGISWASFYPSAASLASGRKCTGTSEQAKACFSSYVSNVYGRWYKPNSTFSWSNADVTASAYKVIYVAQRLFRDGVLAAADYKENGVQTADVKIEKSTESVSQTQDYVYVNFTINNMPEDGSINVMGLECPQCSANGITYQGMEYEDRNGDYRWLTSTVDLSKEINSRGYVRVRLSFTKDETREDCNSATWTLKYNQYDPSQEFIGGLLKDPNIANSQRFAILLKNETVAKTETGSVSCYKEVCDTEIDVPLCSYDEDDAVASITAPKKIQKCILENVDDAGNTYQLSENNGGVENDYCSVFCKEDYAEIRLNPIVEDVKCGGYFKLHAHIDGSKDCYTSGGKDTDYAMDKEQYLKDIIQAQKDMIDNYDLFKNYEAAYNHAGSVVGGTCDSCDGGGSTYYDAVTPSGESTTYTKHYYNENEINYNTGYVPIKTETANHKTDSNPGDSGSCSSNSAGECSSCSGCYSGSLSNLKDRLAESRDYYEEETKKAYKRLISIINNYNSCTTGWDNEFQFAQRIKYEYAEKYYDYLSYGDKYLEAIRNSLEEDSEIEVCLGNVNDKYECLNRSYKITGETDLEDYNYSENYSSVFSNKTYTYCTSEGCQTLTTKISDARYVRKTEEKSQDYITPTVFYQIYPSGKITVNDNYAGSSLQLHELLNKLPVSTQTVGGGIFKLIIEDLGEFYEDGDLGRLIDFDNDREEDSVAYNKELSGDDTFNGEYVCYYESPCRPDDCPDCDFSCEGEYCEFTQCPDCTITCVNCIFDLYELQLNFKTISTNNFGSANREYGYNWNINTQLGSLSLIADKAETTIDEIVSKNETIYESEDKTTSDSSLAFSIKMTPNVTNYIKSYNDKVEKENIGGYANDSLTCYDYDGYANILCYSNFLDELIDKFDNEGLITVRNRTNVNERNSNPNSQGYWTLWDGYVYNESVIGGPSWK